MQERRDDYAVVGGGISGIALARGMQNQELVFMPSRGLARPHVPGEAPTPPALSASAELVLKSSPGIGALFTPLMGVIGNHCYVGKADR